MGSLQGENGCVSNGLTDNLIYYIHVNGVYIDTTCIHDLIRDEKKEERSKQGQTNNKAKQHSTPKAVTFPKKNELLRVGGTHVWPDSVPLSEFIADSFRREFDFHTT